MQEYEIHRQTPSIEAYRHLRAASGLSPKTEEAARAGLAGTWHAIVACRDGRPVGMGRIVGDGGCHFQIVDVCVLPEHQGRGVGKMIMEALVSALERAPATAYVSLIADGDARYLYEKYGFAQTAPDSVGMARQF